MALVALLFTSGYLVFQSPYVQHRIIDLITRSLVMGTKAEFTIGRVDVKWFRHFVLEEVCLSDETGDTLVYCEELTAKIDSLSLSDKRLKLKSISADKALVHIRKTDSLKYNFSFLLPDPDVPVQPLHWKISLQTIGLRRTTLVYDPLPDSTGHAEVIRLKKLDFLADSISYGPYDRFAFRIKKMKFKNSVEPSLNNFEARVLYADTVLTLSNLAASTNSSSLEVPFLKLDFSKIKRDGIGALGIDLDLARIDVGFSDLAFWKPFLSGSELKMNGKGRFTGSLGDLKAKGVNISFDRLGNLVGDFYLNGLPDFEHTYIFANLDQSLVNVSSLRQLQWSSGLQNYTPTFPEILDNLGSFQYQGNFTGFYNDFVAYGTFSSDLGTLIGDLSFKPDLNQNTIINGHLSTRDFDLGAVTQNKLLGKLNLSGDINGRLSSNRKYNLDFKGEITSLGFNNYIYTNIRLDGLLRNNRFEGNFSVNDRNLAMDFSGGVDFSSQKSVFDFTAHVGQANLGQLGLYPDSLSRTSFVIESNFTGKNIDDFTGQVMIEDLAFRNSIDSLTLSHIDLQTVSKRDSNMLVVKSDWIDAEIAGSYNFEHLVNSAQCFIRDYLPATFRKVKSLENDPNRFSFEVKVKNIDPVTRVFFPGIDIQTPFRINGVYQPLDHNVWVETKVPSVSCHKERINDLAIRIEGNDLDLTGTVSCNRLQLSDSLVLYNVAVDSKSYDNQTRLDFEWSNLSDNTVKSRIRTLSDFSVPAVGNTPHIDLRILPSAVFAYDSLWQIKEALVTIDSTTINISGIEIQQADQQLKVNGTLSKSKDQSLVVDVSQIDLKLLDPLLGKTPLTGKINGTVEVRDSYSKMQLNTDLTVDRFSFSGGELGVLTLLSSWDKTREKLYTNIHLKKDQKNVASSVGYIDLTTGSLDLDVVLDHTPVTLLDVFMPPDFDSFSGSAEGKVKITGTIQHLLMDGKIYPVGPFSIGLSYLNTVYYSNDPVVLSNDTIYFPDMKIYDDYRNTGIFSGYIRHVSFLQMVFNMTATTDKILVMDNSIEDSPYFYGTAFAGGTIKITGRGDDILLSGNAWSAKGTQINIPFETTQNAVSYPFIQFTQKNRELAVSNDKYNIKTGGMTMNFDLVVTPDAKVQLIINPMTGEMIKGEGNGTLNVKVNKNYDIELYGNYEIEKGDYLFTLLNVINKKFTIEPGGTLNWTGDPYNAQVNLQAVYKLNASLKDLLLDSYSDIDVTRRIPINCLIRLTDELLQPTINFQIDLPTADDRVKEVVNQVIVTEEDKNRQLISLLLSGRFYTPEYLAGTASSMTGTQLVQSTLGSTVSELLSNQISNWANQLTNVVDVGFNYRPGMDEAKDQFEMALGTQFLNDRITINGNIANNANPNSINNSAIVGDFDLLIKLTQNGKLQFKAYTHTNDHSTYDLASNTQGLGFIYKEEFNSFRELFKRYREAIFKRRKKK